MLTPVKTPADTIKSTADTRKTPAIFPASGNFSMFQNVSGMFRAQNREKSIFRPSIYGPKRGPSVDFFSSACSPLSTLSESILKSAIDFLYLEKFYVENLDFWSHGPLADFATAIFSPVRTENTDFLSANQKKFHHQTEILYFSVDSDFLSRDGFFFLSGDPPLHHRNSDSGDSYDTEIYYNTVCID